MTRSEMPQISQADLRYCELWGLATRGHEAELELPNDGARCSWSGVAAVAAEDR